MFYVKRQHENRVYRASQLAVPFSHKCYICERKSPAKPVIEHRIPKSAPDKSALLSGGWNLFYSCPYCNGLKSDDYYDESDVCPHGHGYLGIIDCTRCNPNDFIVIRIDDEDNITIDERSNAPCVANTKSLLNKVYGVGVALENDDLSTLNREVQAELSILVQLVRKLKNDVKCVEERLDLINEDIDELTLHMHPRRAFFAIKLSYLQEIRDSAKNAKLREILGKILADQSIQPRISAPSCVYSGQGSSQGGTNG